MKKLGAIISIIIMTLVIFTFGGCKKDNNGSGTTIQNIVGYAQKGPFINGSSITVYDLQSDLSPTGRTFDSQIIDDKGTFELNDFTLSSDYIRLKAEGFYFNEILGKQSTAQITLYALANIKGKTNINVNLLTHLERSRVEHLLKSGKSFSDAKAQAQKEILAIFSIQKTNIQSSENLNIIENGDDNAILLAISLILQGYRTEGELSELLSSISEDISSDGILNSDTLGSELINHAVVLDTTGIKNNLIQRYTSLGLSPTIPDFGKYIANFISKTAFKITGSIINYPKTGLYGSNLLSLNDTIYNSYDYSLAAYLPTGTRLKVKITVQSPGQIWWYNSGTEANWSITTFNGTSQTFTAINSGTNCDLHLIQFSSGYYLIEYFETSSSTPTRKKLIKI